MGSPPDSNPQSAACTATIGWPKTAELVFHAKTLDSAVFACIICRGCPQERGPQKTQLQRTGAGCKSARLERGEAEIVQDKHMPR